MAISSSISALLNNSDAETLTSPVPPGVELLDRSNRTVTPTAAGRVFIDETRPGVEAIDQARLLVSRVASGAVERVQVGHSGGAGLELIERALRQLVSDEAHLQIQVREAPSNELSALLLDGALDLALVRPPLHEERLDEQHLLDEVLVAVVPADHPLAHRHTIPLAELAGLPFVMPPRRDARAASILALVAAGSGVTILPRHYGMHYGVNGV